jgi:hypothetical protein
MVYVVSPAIRKTRQPIVPRPDTDFGSKSAFSAGMRIPVYPAISVSDSFLPLLSRITLSLYTSARAAEKITSARKGTPQLGRMIISCTACTHPSAASFCFDQSHHDPIDGEKLLCCNCWPRRSKPLPRYHDDAWWRGTWCIRLCVRVQRPT